MRENARESKLWTLQDIITSLKLSQLLCSDKCLEKKSKLHVISYIATIPPYPSLTLVQKKKKSFGGGGGARIEIG